MAQLLTETFSRQNLTREAAPHLWEQLTTDVWKFMGDERALGVWQEGRVIVEAYVRRGGAWVGNTPHILHVSSGSNYILDPPPARVLKIEGKRVAVSIDKNGKAAFTRLKDKRDGPSTSSSEESEMSTETEAQLRSAIEALGSQNHLMAQQITALTQAVQQLTMQVSASSGPRRSERQKTSDA